jgi:hypothetical protein
MPRKGTSATGPPPFSLWIYRGAFAEGAGTARTLLYLHAMAARTHTHTHSITHKHTHRWGNFERKRRDTVARAAFGGVGRLGDGIHVMHAEERGQLTSAADMKGMVLPDVFPSDVDSDKASRPFALSPSVKTKY